MVSLVFVYNYETCAIALLFLFLDLSWKIICWCMYTFYLYIDFDVKKSRQLLMWKRNVLIWILTYIGYDVNLCNPTLQTWLATVTTTVKSGNNCNKQVTSYQNSQTIVPAEGRWLPPGHAGGGPDDGGLLGGGAALVRGRHRPLPRPRGLAQDGHRVQRTRRAAPLPRGQASLSILGKWECSSFRTRVVRLAGIICWDSKTERQRVSGLFHIVCR